MRIPSDLDLFRDMILDLSSSILSIPFGKEGWQDHYFEAAQKASDYKLMAERVIGGVYQRLAFDSTLSEIGFSDSQAGVTGLITSEFLPSCPNLKGHALWAYLNGDDELLESSEVGGNLHER